MHKTRSQTPKLWAIPRKGTRFLVVSNHNQYKGISLLIVLRDMMGVGKTRKEIKRIILLEKVKVNGKLIKDEKFPLVLFDVLSLENKSYKLVIKNKKFALEETKDSEKISKVIGKKILGKDKTQINLNDGRNFLSKEKMSVGDSVVFNFKENKISKVIPLKENCEIIVISGSHIGEKGKIEKINEKTSEAETKLDEKKASLQLKRLMAI